MVLKGLFGYYLSSRTITHLLIHMYEECALKVRKQDIYMTYTIKENCFKFK